MRMTLLAALAAVVLLAVPSRAQASASDDIQTANKAGQVVFLVVTDAAAKNIEAARTSAREAQKRVKLSTVVELNRSKREHAAAVKRYRLQSAPLPLILVIAQNGVAVGASRAGKGSIERLVSLVPTPKKADMILAFEMRKTAVVVFSRPKMKEQSPLFQNLTTVTREMKDKVHLVLVNLDDKAEKKFIDEWKIPMASLRPTIVVMNAKGQTLDRLVGLQTAEKIVQTCKKRAPCCDDPGCKGCEDK